MEARCDALLGGFCNAGYMGKEMTATEIMQAVRMALDARPRPTQVNQSQAAEMLGLSHPTIRKLVRSGVLPLNGCGLIPIEAVDSARDAKRAA